MLVLVKGDDVKSAGKATLVMAGSKIWKKKMIILTVPAPAPAHDISVGMFAVFFYILRLIFLFLQFSGLAYEIDSIGALVFFFFLTTAKHLNIYAPRDRIVRERLRKWFEIVAYFIL